MILTHTCFITKIEVSFFLVCALDRDFWERILSLNSHVSLFYLLFYSLFYIHVVVVVVHQGSCWEDENVCFRKIK